MAVDSIKMNFVKNIMRSEWREFEDVQDRIIRLNTRRRSGTLRNEFHNRQYSVSGSNLEVRSKLKHPDYERFLDMKKDRIVSTRVARFFKDRQHMVRRPGRAIHNRVIFGRLNPISFRLMHELRVQVTEEVRKNVSSGTITF